MTKLLSKKTYELDSLMHAFMPVFQKHSYNDLLSSVDPHLDLVKTAKAKIAKDPSKYDLDLKREDPWFTRLKLMMKNANADYSWKLQEVLQSLSHNPLLNSGQQQVFAEIDDVQYPVATIKGNAGAGKSFATAEMIKELMAANAKTLVLAPTHVAVTNMNQLIDDLRQQRFDQNLKANKLIDKSANMTIATLTSWTFRNKHVIEDIVSQEFVKDKNVEDYDIIIIDEAFATNGSALMNVFLYAMYIQKPVLLIGDPNQLPSIQNQPLYLLDMMLDEKVLFNTTTLSQVMRTNDQDIVSLATAVQQNNMSKMAKFYAKPDVASTNATQLLSTQDFDSDYWLKIYMAVRLINQSQQDPFGSIALVPTNALRIELNNIVQEQMIAQGLRDITKSIKLPNGVLLTEKDIVMISETQEVTDLTTTSKSKVRLRGATRIQIIDVDPVTPSGTKYNKYHKDALRWNDNRYRIKIYAPDLDREMIVDLFELSSSGYNPGMHDPDIHELYHDLNLGYVATVNKVQGLSIDHVQVYLDKPYPHVSRNLLYSAVTRARMSVSLISDPKTLQKALYKVENMVR